MISQFNNLSSWREDNIVIEPHETYTLTFLDTNPNMFVIINPNVAMLKVSISSMPTTERFETKVEYNSTETFGRPTGTRYLYILNDSSKKISIKVFSIYGDFDISILKNLNVSLHELSIETSSILEGFASGVSLPSGDNTIGKVGFTTAEQNLLTAIKTAINNLGWNSSKITNIINAINTLKPTITAVFKTDTILQSGLSATYTGTITGINFIRCTSGNIKISIDGGASYLTINNGESINDIIADMSSIKITANEDNSSYDLIYYKKG